MSRRSLRLPISLAVVMIVIAVLTLVVFVIMAVVWGIPTKPNSGGAIFWTFFVLGILFLVLIVVGVVLYLTLSIKAINLTRRQSNFIDSVTHELKSPIASLKLYLQTLSRRPVNAQEQAEFYQFMLEDVERLDQLINHVLSAARLEKKALPDDTERIDLRELLTSCIREVCLQYRISTDRVTVDLQPCMIQGNRVDLALIFRNLIDNAIKYADGHDPEVGVVAQFDPEKGHAVVRISDNGPGIPSQLRRKVFRRFFRLGTELERKKPGTGLGLYIVRTLVDRWKGRIQVSSRDTGEGTVFEVALPNASVVALDGDKRLEDSIDNAQVTIPAQPANAAVPNTTAGQQEPSHRRAIS